jgi:FKBP-type peptidyl-prolyl cis-trans isomerase (trigger factor)
LSKLPKKEKISITEKEMNQMIMQEAFMLHISPNQLVAEIKDNYERIQELKRRAIFGKALDFVLLSNLKEKNSEQESNLKKDNPGSKAPPEAVSSENSDAAANVK